MFQDFLDNLVYMTFEDRGGFWLACTVVLAVILIYQLLLRFAPRAVAPVHKFLSRHPLIWICIPAALLIYFVYVSLGWNLWVSVSDWQAGELEASYGWGGFGNYAKMFGSANFWPALKNTLLLFCLIPLCLLLGLGLAKLCSVRGAKEQQLLALLACMLLLYFTGVANLYSASGTRVETGFAFESFYQRQLVWGLCGLGCMLLAMLFDYRQLRNLAWPAYLVFLILLMLVPLVGSTFYGAKRWISFGLFTIQPSEPIKIAVLILVARLLARDSQPLGWKNFISVLAVGLVPMVFILKQPDLGTAMMVLLIMGGMILFHGLRRYVLGTCLLAVPGVAALMWCVLMHDYQKQRVLTFLNPGDDPLGAGYHILQSRIAIGSGELWGKGYMEGMMNKLNFLPERHSDFALAVFGEEWGFVGCVALVTLFCLFLLSIFSTVVQAKDRFGSMLAVGVFFYFFWQICINMGMVIGLMPVVGIPLPFISYGGSATVVNFTLLGIVLNVSMRRFMFKS